MCSQSGRCADSIRRSVLSRDQFLWPSGAAVSVIEPRNFDRLPQGFRNELPDPRRADPDRLAHEVMVASRSPIVTALLSSTDSVLLILNEQRQIVASSEHAAGVAATSELRGHRLGEALGCVNAQTPAGCGTMPACRGCGALGAILQAQSNCRPTEAECLMRSVVGGGASFEFGVRAALATVEGVRFTLVSLRDISADKRREALEQVFLHDVLNTVMGLRGWTTRLRRPGCDVPRATERLDLLTRQLEREIRYHRDLVLAEAGTLTVTPVRVECWQLLQDLEGLCSSHAAAEERRLVIPGAAPSDLELRTDPQLLLRVLANMVRNAFEATGPGGTVRVWAEAEVAGPGEGNFPAVRFSVHNDGYIPAEVRDHIFVRSFSTKGGRGRGLGTYSMKLLGERHLGGEVAFASSVEAGTTFWIRLPVAGPPA